MQPVLTLRLWLSPASVAQRIKIFIKSQRTTFTLSVQDCENYTVRGGKFSPIHVGDFALNFFVQNLKWASRSMVKLEPCLRGRVHLC